MPKTFVICAVTLFTLYILSPFLAAVGMGAIFAVLFYPWMKRIDRGRFPNSLAAGCFTLTVTLLIFLPVCGLTVAGVRSGLTELRQIKRMNPGSMGPSSSDEVLDKMFSSTGIEKLLVNTARVLPIDPPQVAEQLKDLIAGIAVHLGDGLSNFIGHIPSMAVAFSVFLFSLFYFLADGLKFVQIFRERSLFSAAHTERLFKVFSGLCRSVILASVISGCVQALIAMSVCASLDIKQFPTVFMIVFVASFVPVVGSFPIMIGMALYQWMGGHLVSGSVIAVAAIFIAAVDNVIRPQVIRGSSNLHPLLGFVSALGGLETFGITGIFLGPVLCGLAVELVAIAQD